MTDLTPECTECHTSLHDGLTAVNLSSPIKNYCFLRKREHLCRACLRLHRGRYRLVKKS